MGEAINTALDMIEERKASTASTASPTIARGRS